MQIHITTSDGVSIYSQVVNPVSDVIDHRDHLFLRRYEPKRVSVRLAF
jgi:hypothetical protein